MEVIKNQVIQKGVVMNIDQLILYRDFKYEDLLRKFCSILSCETEQSEKRSADFYSAAHELVNLAGAYGFQGNLWHCFLAFCLANNENAYSTAAEIVGKVEGSLNDLMLHDCSVLKQLFDLSPAEAGDAAVAAVLMNYQPPKRKSRVFNQRVRDRILDLSVALEKTENAASFKDAVTEFYREFGVGKFGLNKAFNIKEAEDGSTLIDPITRIEHIYLKNIIGYERQKQQLIDNTEAFLNGIPANNVLLFGDAGTGKSSSVKAIVNEYYDRGLRIIEVYKHQFRMLSDVLEQVKDRNYKFIIYMDDLSFEDSELEYKYLKAILEGGIGRKPDNVLIYATSNRRHLIRESFKDKDEADEELHRRDTVQEKLSLSARFGVTIYFGSPNKSEFQNIVKGIAEREGIDMPENQLLLEANAWEIRHGGLSGRTANQFITYLKAKKAEAERN